MAYIDLEENEQEACEIACSLLTGVEKVRALIETGIADTEEQALAILRQLEEQAADERDPAYEAYVERELARGELAFTADDAPCYTCGREARAAGTPHEEDPTFMVIFKGEADSVPLPFITRKITALGHVVNNADPTQSYVLECGHVTI